MGNLPSLMARYIDESLRPVRCLTCLRRKMVSMSPPFNFSQGRSLQTAGDRCTTHGLEFIKKGGSDFGPHAIPGLRKC